MEISERLEMVRGESAFAADAVVCLTKALRTSGQIESEVVDQIEHLILQHLNAPKGHFVEARAHVLQRRLRGEDVDLQS